MKIIGITTARNEADIIEAFVRHTLAYCDALIVLDHWSSDTTPAILQSLKAEGLPLHLLHDATQGSMQMLHMNKMLRMARADFGADWVLCLDTDEFLQGPGIEALRHTPPNGEVLKIPLYNYVVHPSDRLDVSNPVERIVQRISRVPSEWYNFKTIVPGSLADTPDALLVRGNHKVEIAGIEVAHQNLPEAWLGHFSLRSPGQYATKMASCLFQFSLNRNPHRGQVAFYNQDFERAIKSFSTFQSDFHNTRLSWEGEDAQTTPELLPIDYRGGPLKYTARLHDTDQFIQSLARLAQGIVMTAAQGVSDKADTPGPLAQTSILLEQSPSSSSSSQAASIDHAQRLPQNQAGFIALAFPLLPDAPAETLRFSCNTSPGILELASIALYGSKGETAEYSGKELCDVLESDSKAVLLRGSTSARFICSKHSFFIRVKLSALRDKGLAFTPTRVALSVLFTDDPKTIADIVLSSKTIDQINRKHVITIDGTQAAQKYSLSTLVDFSINGTGGAYIAEGWRPPEKWGFWSNAPKSSLRIPLKKETTEALRFKIKSRSRPWNKQGAAFQPAVTLVSVLVEDREIACWEIDSDRYSTFEAIIPTASAPRQVVEITFAYRYREGTQSDTRDASLREKPRIGIKGCIVESLRPKLFSKAFFQKLLRQQPFY